MEYYLSTKEMKYWKVNFKTLHALSERRNAQSVDMMSVKCSEWQMHRCKNGGSQGLEEGDNEERLPKALGIYLTLNVP